ncbi:hypothetical protein QA641_09855 [Bradyrhizobium sp. CB1650]|uniref:hypothetical protein n=1 Tax=Bradyrhizobium sp. CB1650 TaxID=3039153 RepID=UPI002434EC34|nr:hypothetical protein [Bradyrhizobium sp. CB1650]WGD54163.1 hypothetical protein QA641_09855 [Bradyrhizobium sp. CB1650]
MPKSNLEFYKECNLDGNPFRSNATFDNDPRLAIWAGQAQERQLLEKFLARSRAEQVGNANLILLYGTYGTGKSHALLWGMHWLRQMNSAGQSVAYYIPTLKKDKGRLTFAGAFKDDLIAKTSLVDDVLQYRNFLGICVNQYRAENKLGTDVSADDIIEKLIPPVELYNFAKEINHQEDGAAVRALLAPKSQTDYQAMITFTRLVNLFVYELRFKDETKRFRQSVHLMIDELDVLTQASTKEILEVSDLIRHIYDLCPNCFGLVLAVSAEQEIIASIFAEYVIGRVTRQIEFKPMDRDAAVEFVIQVMDEMRLEKGNKTKLRAFPFSKSALEAILGQLSFRTPRKIVNVMQQVIEEARIAELTPGKSAITVEALDKAGLMDEIL